MAAAAPSDMVIMTAREWATTSCISRAIRLRSLAAASMADCSRARARRVERVSNSWSWAFCTLSRSPTRTPMTLKRVRTMYSNTRYS